MTHDKERSAHIAALNDALRQANRGGVWMTTSGVAEESSEFFRAAVAAVKAFDAFTPDNDPYDEHDFGSFELGGAKLFWKIDCYEKGSDHTAGAETPENPEVTERVLTIMLAEEY